MMLLFVIQFLVTCIITSLSISFYRKYQKFQTFRRRNIKGPKPNLLLGNYLDLRQSPDNKLPHEVITDWINQFGNIFGYYSPDRCRLVINDASILKKISVHKAFQDREPLVLNVVPIRDSLFATGGETWRRSRKTISPLLSRFKVNSPPVTTIITDSVDNYLKHLRPNDVPEGSSFTIDIVGNIHRFTFDIICRTSLGMDSDCYSENDQLVKAVVEFFQNAFNSAVVLAEVFPLFSHLLTFINNHLTAGRMTDSIVGYLKNQIKELIKLKQSNVHNDGDDDGGSAVFLKSMLTFLADGKLNEEEFIGNIHLIVLAGFEATANGLIFCLYLIAKHQQIQERMRESLKKETEEEESYIEMVWLEALRYYPPPLLVINRQASEDVDIDGLFIEKGWVIEAPVWQIHHSDRYWPDPWTFNPERFSSVNRKNIEPSSFLSYGFGGRTCLGMNLANIEARRLLSALVSKYRISFCEKTMDPPKFKIPSTILNPDGPVYLKFEPIE